MTLFHGVNVQELDTNILPPREISAAIPFVVGVAPIHLSDSASADVLNKPVLINTYQEYVETFGDALQSLWGKYTLSEFAYIFFRLYGVGPAIFVNVMDPSTDGTAVAAEAAVLVAGQYTLAEDAVLSSLVVKSDDGLTTYDITDDYTAAYNSSGQIVITRVTTGSIPTDTSALTLDYDKIGDTPCLAADIIGGVDGTTGDNQGLECIEDVYAVHQLIPGLIVAPGFSNDATVAAAMAAKAEGFNSLFSCMALCDIDSSAAGADLYSEVSAWKTTNSYTSAYMLACWPKVKLGDNVYWMSSHVAGRIAKTDADNDNVPFVSPSNKDLRINGLVLEDGTTEVIMTIPKADTLSQIGVVTGLNFNGWKCWGNRTGAYPGSTDPKDAFSSVRRMFSWVGNSVVLLLWQKLDDPINRRTVETAVDSANQFLNGLISKGALNDGRCEFVSVENPTVDLADGKVTLHLYLTPPSPAEQITAVLEYDVAGNSAVWS